MVNFIIYSLKYKACVIVEINSWSRRYGFLDITKQEEVQGNIKLKGVAEIVKAAELIV